MEVTNTNMPKTKPRASKERTTPALKTSDLARDIQLLFEIGTLRHVDRVWKQFMNPDVANCADHIFRTAWIALTIAKYEGAGDHEKILKIALAHDLSETRTGDVHYLSRQYTARNDKMAVEDIFEGTLHKNEMTELMNEYEERKTIEAKIVKDADNIDVELELCELRAKGYSLGRIWTERRLELLYPKLFTKTAERMWKEVAKSEPHDWHNKSPRNRFEKGDWQKQKKNGKKPAKK
jgi:putative hydrolase of HD superfamily